jgi:hypothetical protein
MRISAMVIVAGLTLSGAAQAAERSFDGTWDTVLSCTNASGAYGYSFKFVSVVRDNSLHGQKGSKGEPGWLSLDGPIAGGGSASLYVDGIVGAAPYAVGDRPAGTQYGYHVNAKFDGASGTGHRVEGRPCTVTFVKN